MGKGRTDPVGKRCLPPAPAGQLLEERLHKASRAHGLVPGTPGQEMGLEAAGPPRLQSWWPAPALPGLRQASPASPAVPGCSGRPLPVRKAGFPFLQHLED